MRHLLTFIFIAITLSTFSQGYYPPIINYSSKEYKINKLNDDGTPYAMGPENYAVVQDNRGVMYFGNSNGILEYDGENWNFIEVVLGRIVSSLAKDSLGTIYVGSTGDFGFLKPNSQHQLEFYSLADSLPEEYQFFSGISSIFASETKVYFQSSELIFIYDIKSKNLNIIEADVSFHRSFMVEGDFYVRQRGFGIQKLIDGKLITLKGTEYIFGLFEETGYGCFGVFKSNYSDSLIIITQEQGMFKWYNDSLISLHDPDFNEINDMKLHDAVRLSDGNIALSTYVNGVYVVNEQGDVLRSVNETTGLRSNDVKSMYEDKDQNLWLGLGNGIAKVNYFSSLSYYNDKAGINGDVQAFMRYNGLLYVGSSFGLFVQNSNIKKTKEFISVNGIIDQVWDFRIVNSKLYIATTEGVWGLESPTNYKKISNLNTNKIYSNGNIIVTAGKSGIFMWDNKFNLLESFNIELSNALSIVQDPTNKSMIWIGTSGSGVFRLDIENNFEITYYGEMEGLNSDELAKPLLLDNKMVFGCSNGLLKFISEDEVRATLEEEYKDNPEYYGGMFDITSFYDSLFIAEILLIKEDKNKTWFSADQKIGYYDISKKQFINKPFWGINYGRINEFYLEENGVLWVGCADGVIRYNENNQKNYKSKFTSLIREVTITNDSIIYYGSGIQLENEFVVIDYDNNDLKFIFSSPYFEDEHSPEYTFQLEGYEKKWSNWEDDNFANYTNLSEGDYIFKIKAKNIYGTISDVAIYRFTISPPWYKTILAYFVYFILSLLLIYIVIRISSKRLKTKNEWLEGVVEERTKEISEKNDVLEHKNVEILLQKKEIEDSINYAKRIQTAILPLDVDMKQSLPNSFVLFRPKDIVSGDFYWYTKHGNKLIIVCADCTGHGVPGAFMSMIGSDRLNIIVNERHETSPGKILSELNRAIKNTLKQGEGKGSTKDGMDAAICTIDLITGSMVYAGAYRPLWIVENGELSEIKATKVAVAGFTPDDQVFDEHTIILKKGLRFYMTTDGYADQFGGVKGKKYKVKAMKNFILSICESSYNQQSIKLEEEIVRWMDTCSENCEQIDDICVIGFEI